MLNREQHIKDIENKIKVIFQKDEIKRIEVKLANNLIDEWRFLTKWKEDNTHNIIENYILDEEITKNIKIMNKDFEILENQDMNYIKKIKRLNDGKIFFIGQSVNIGKIVYFIPDYINGKIKVKIKCCNSKKSNPFITSYFDGLDIERDLLDI